MFRVSLGNLSNLQRLYLTRNSLGGCIPESLFAVAVNDMSDLGLPTCAEYDALVALYNAADGANWTDNTNWLSAEPAASWHGVTTDAGGRIIGLSLANNGLSGTIPTQLGDLTNLQTLSLSGNSLSGTIPTQLGDLTNLQTLSLSGNSLSGTIPTQLGDLTNLQTLSLSGNSLTGCVPDSLYQAPSNDMSSLGLPSCTEKDALVALYNATDGANWTDNTNWLSEGSLGDWYGVTTDADGRIIGLSLADNNLSGTLPSELKDLVNLQTVYLANNSLSGCIPDNLYQASMNDAGSLGLPPCTEKEALAALYNATDGANWTGSRNWLSDRPLGEWSGVYTGADGRVTQLRLHSRGLSGTIPAELGNLASLQYLALNDNNLSGAIPTQLGNLANLTELYLDGNDLSGSIPAELGNLASLQYLYLEDNALSGTIPTQLGNLASLTLMSFGNNDLSGSIPAELGNLANLTDLYLYENNLSGSIPAELGNLARLTTLQISGNGLSGCIPDSLYSVSINDLANLGLPTCQ